MHGLGLVPRLALLRLRYGWQSPGAQQLGPANPGNSSMACQLAIVFHHPQPEVDPQITEADEAGRCCGWSANLVVAAPVRHTPIAG